MVLSTGRKRGLLLVWLVMFLLLAAPLYGQSILTQAVSGTGFIVSSDGYIITNRHVINGATKISVTIDNKEYEATVVDSLSDNDIALLKVDAHGLPAVMLGDSDNVQIGDTVYAIGCPAGVCGTITQGRVANLEISSKTDEGTALHNLIMSDLTTTHGSSGGPLLNDKGEVIGITTAGIVVQGETTGFGVSIPINQAIPLLRKMPGFSTSQMGKATTVLSLNEIRRSVGAGTVFVQAETRRSLRDFLPREAIGRSLTYSCDNVRTWTPVRMIHRFGPSPTEMPCEPGDSGITLSLARLWNYLSINHVDINSVAEARYTTVEDEGTSTFEPYFGGPSEEISVAIFECASRADASRALMYLSVPRTWALEIPTDDPVLSLLHAPQIKNTSWGNDHLQRSKIFQSRSRTIEDTIMNTTMAWYGSAEYNVQTSKFDENVYTNFTPFVDIWGFTHFSVSNLIFHITYYRVFVGHRVYNHWIKVDPLQYVFRDPPSYKWEQVGHSFVFSSAKYPSGFSVDYEPFLESFDQLLTTVFGTLANQ